MSNFSMDLPRIGEVHQREESDEFVIEWKIHNFLELSDYVYYSPSFSFTNASLCLNVFPNGGFWSASKGRVQMFLRKETPGLPITLEYTLGLKTVDEKIDFPRKSAFNFQSFMSSSFALSFRRAEIFKRKSELVPFGTLTVVCRLKAHFEAAATEKLLSDLKSMMITGDHSDTVIKVKGEEFRLHRSVLASRNPYFHSMFQSGMKENNTGIVTIDDCEPDLFRSFIHFVYTGKVDELTLENVCDLYELADKYQEDQLKNQCLLFMMSMLSLDTFCDFTVMAFRFGEKELLENAVKFFANKSKEILRSAKCRNLLREYPLLAKELLFKGLK